MNVEHTCDGANLPPQVEWGGAPSQTKVYVLRMYDPDAPADTFLHWIGFNIQTTRVGPGNLSFLHGYNDFGRAKYDGPCPPLRDEAHRYVIEIYALSEPLRLNSPVTWERLRSAMEGKVLAHAHTMLRYKRQKR